MKQNSRVRRKKKEKQVKSEQVALETIMEEDTEK